MRFKATIELFASFVINNMTVATLNQICHGGRNGIVSTKCKDLLQRENTICLLVDCWFHEDAEAAWA